MAVQQPDTFSGNAPIHVIQHTFFFTFVKKITKRYSNSKEDAQATENEKYCIVAQAVVESAFRHIGWKLSVVSVPKMFRKLELRK